jgi:hypothetical protein
MPAAIHEACPLVLHSCHLSSIADGQFVWELSGAIARVRIDIQQTKKHEQNKFKRQGRHTHDNGAGSGDPKRNRAGERRQSSGRQFCGTRSERRRA